MSASLYCVCGKLAVGPRTIVSGSMRHSRLKCIEYELDRNGRQAVVRMVSAETPKAPSAAEVKS